MKIPSFAVKQCNVPQYIDNTFDVGQSVVMDKSMGLPEELPRTPPHLVAASVPPRHTQTQNEHLSANPESGLLEESIMQNAFTDLKAVIADMEKQLEQFEFVLDQMRNNMVRVDDSGQMLGAFDEDDLAIWEKEQEAVRTLKDAYENDFGKRIHVYERKVQDASSVVRRRMQFFNDVDDRFGLIGKRPALMRVMARKQAELVRMLSETQRILLRDMKNAVARYRKESKDGQRRDFQVSTVMQNQGQPRSETVSRAMSLSRPVTKDSGLGSRLRFESGTAAGDIDTHFAGEDE